MILSTLFVLAQAASAAPPTTAPSEPPSTQAAAAVKGPIVTLDTSLGKVRILLKPDKAPITVDNFLKYVRAGHYDGTIFHRVIPRFMVQGGGFEPDMRQRTETLRPPIKNEARNGLRNVRGTIVMARTSDPNSATAQFFINVVDNASLDFGMRGAGYAVFGEVVEGMDVVDKIAAVPTGTKAGMGDVPQTPVVIKTARESAGK